MSPVPRPADRPAGATPERGPQERPRGPRIVLRASAAVFGALARARRSRSMHGPGVAYRCRVRIDPPAGLVSGAPFFAREASYDATIRFSRGIGLPQPLADLLGVAVRVHAAHPDGAPQDLLVTSSGGRRGTRRLLLPARDGFFGQWFSSVLPYRVGDVTTVLGLRAATPPAGEGTDFERLAATHARGDLVFVLALAARAGWTGVGRVHVGARLPDDEATALSFEPWTSGPGIRPVGVLNLLRSAAYPASRRARRAWER